MGRALWRELVVGFASQLGELRLGFTQLAALYVLADGSTTTVGELAEALGRSPSATSRLVDGLGEAAPRRARRGARGPPAASVALTQRGQAILRAVDRARADQFLTTVRPMPTPERALVAMGVAALATHAISRRGRLIEGRRASQAPRRARRGSSAARPGRGEQDDQGHERIAAPMILRSAGASWTAPPGASGPRLGRGALAGREDEDLARHLRVDGAQVGTCPASRR